MKSVKQLFDRRKYRVRGTLRKVSGGRPRLSVFRSNRHIYAQVIDDARGVTVASASSLEKTRRDDLKGGSDKQAAERIGPTNRRRLIRALEVYEATGRPISYWQAKEPPDFETLVIGLRLPRDELYRRIDGRVERMMTSGLIEDARRLLARCYSRELPSMSGIGYKEACAHLAGEMTTEAAEARIKTETHRLARHQNAWCKANDPRIRWMDAEGSLEEAARLIASELGVGKEVARGR